MEQSGIARGSERRGRTTLSTEREAARFSGKGRGEDDDDEGRRRTR
jgi:hypothetical protein